jgi:hypothetical protein
MCLIFLACTPVVYYHPLSLALFLLISTRFGPLCCLSLFFMFLHRLGVFLLPRLGTLLWCTPFIFLTPYSDLALDFWASFCLLRVFFLTLHQPPYLWTSLDSEMELSSQLVNP